MCVCSAAEKKSSICVCSAAEKKVLHSLLEEQHAEREQATFILLDMGEIESMLLLRFVLQSYVFVICSQFKHYILRS